MPIGTDDTKVIIVSRGFRGYVNEIECSTKGVAKYPDSSLCLNISSNRRRISPPVIIEIALRNENLRQLIIEGTNWLNQYSDTDIAVLLHINENRLRTNVVSFDLIVFKRTNPFVTDTVFYPNPECKGWFCASDQLARDMPKADLEAQLDVQIIARVNVSRSSLRARQRVEVNLPLSGLNEYYSPLEPFGCENIIIDLTGYFERLFDMINHSVDEGTYPNLNML